MKKGIFISFEGIDGAGKSTHIDHLAKHWREQGKIVCQTREPGGTPLAEKLRSLLLNDNMDALTEALLVFAARRDHIKQIIEPALMRGEIVLCDRFTDATFAYQGGGRGFDWDVLQKLELMVQAYQGDQADLMLEPNITIWFDLEPELAAKRLESARLPDRFESQSLAFFERVRNAYAKRMQESPKRFIRIKANAAREQIWADLNQQLNPFLSSFLN